MGRTTSHEDSPEPLALGQSSLNQRRVDAGEYARRRSLLRDDPGIDVVNMATLIAVANAIEEESVRRYTLLAEMMERRGEAATAAAFRVMLEEERRHVIAVQRWAASVGESVPAAEAFEWRLPADLSSSWDKLSASTLLTPYRAFAMAVENEKRAFSFYAYLAAHAEDAQVRAEAEKLGAEELRHAAMLRRWRRRAYHRERRPAPPVPLEIDSVEMLHDVLTQHEAAIARTHRALADRLKRVGDEASAKVLERSIPKTVQRQVPATSSGVDDSAAMDTGDRFGAAEPRHLLIDAQKPLEALADTLELVMASADGELFEQAASAMQAIVARIAQISLQISRSDQAQGKRPR